MCSTHVRMSGICGRRDGGIVTGGSRHRPRRTPWSSPARGRRSSSTTSAPSSTARRLDPGPPARSSTRSAPLGGEAVANGDDVADWDGAAASCRRAIDAFGGLDVLVNNAGILRDRMLVNMTRGRVGRRHPRAPARALLPRCATPPPTGASEPKAGAHGRRPRSSTPRRAPACWAASARATTAPRRPASPRSRSSRRPSSAATASPSTRSRPRPAPV